MRLRNVGLKTKVSRASARCTPALGLAPHFAIRILFLLAACYDVVISLARVILPGVVSKLMALIFGPRVRLRWAPFPPYPGGHLPPYANSLRNLPLKRSVRLFARTAARSTRRLLAR
jgi:hypothetical protein